MGNTSEYKKVPGFGSIPIIGRLTTKDTINLIGANIIHEIVAKVNDACQIIF